MGSKERTSRVAGMPSVCLSGQFREITFKNERCSRETGRSSSYIAKAALGFLFKSRRGKLAKGVVDAALQTRGLKI